MNNQVTRLRDEITGKELALAKDQQEHKRLEKDNEALKVRQPAVPWLGVVLSSSSSLRLLFRPFSNFMLGQTPLPNELMLMLVCPHL